MNRAERRARGFYFPVGLLPEGLEVPQEQMMLRYVRRHVLALHPRIAATRRVRKQRARIGRALDRMGLV